MTLPDATELSLGDSGDLARMRKQIGVWLTDSKARPLVKTQLLTVATELGRNTIRHGGGGKLTMSGITEGTRRGLEMIFEDEGPGISDLSQAMQDGFSTAGGLGLGLGGARRLLGSLLVEPRAPCGLRVVARGWIDTR